MRTRCWSMALFSIRHSTIWWRIVAATLSSIVLNPFSLFFVQEFMHTPHNPFVPLFCTSIPNRSCKFLSVCGQVPIRGC